jgi:hypothetical protein
VSMNKILPGHVARIGEKGSAHRIFVESDGRKDK